MQPTSLPPEIQFRFLLDEPYQTIVNYCQANRQAAGICQSDSFWKTKLRREGLDPGLLGLIDGSSPAIRYRILMYIGNAGTARISRAVRRGQFRYVQQMWQPTDPGYLEPDAIVDAIVLGCSEIVELLRDLITNRSGLPPNESSNIFNYLIISTIQSALEDGRADIALYLRSAAGRSHLDLLRLTPDSFDPEDPETLEALLNDAKAHGEQEIVQRFAEELVEDGEVPIVIYLLDHHLEELDPRTLFAKALEECPMALRLSRYVLEKETD